MRRANLPNLESAIFRTKTLIGRREFILGAGGVILSIGSLELVGCGGSGGGSSKGVQPLPTVKTTGLVKFPPGTSFPGYSIKSLTTTTAPDQSGQFQYGAVRSSPVLVGAVSSSGKNLLLGHLDDTHKTLDVNSTAKVLAYSALGVGAFLLPIQQAYGAALDQPGALDQLAAAIQDTMKLNGETWMSVPDGGVQSALSALITTFSSPTGSKANPPTSGGRTQSNSSATPIHSKPMGATVLPEGETSGIELEASGAGKVVVVNHFKRQAYVYVNRVSYVRDVSPTQLETINSPKDMGRIKLPAVYGMTEGFLVALGQFLGGQRYYNPVNSEPIEVPLFPEDDKAVIATNYTLTVVGIGGSLGDFALLDETQLDGLFEIAVESLVYDFILPTILMGFIPINQESINALAGNAFLAPAIQDLVRLIIADHEIHEMINEGQAPSALYAALVLIFNNESLLLALLKGVVELGLLPIESEAEKLENIEFGEVTEKTIHELLTALNVLTQGIDTLITESDMLNASLAVQFTLTETPSKVEVNPATEFVPIFSGSKKFTVKVTDAHLTEEDQITYGYSCDSKFGTISDTMQTGPTINSSTNEYVLYIPNGKALGGDSEKITCFAYLGGVNHRTALGQAEVQITFEPDITPKDAHVQTTATQTFATKVSANVPSDAAFEWTLNGSAGSIGATNVVKTAKPSIVYTAGAIPSSVVGNDTLNVQVLDSNGALITKGSTSIDVVGTGNFVPVSHVMQVGEKFLFSFTGIGATAPPGTYKFLYTLSSTTLGILTAVGGSVSSTGPGELTSDYPNIYVSALAVGEMSLSVSVQDVNGHQVDSGSAQVTIRTIPLDGLMSGTVNDPGPGINNFKFSCTQNSAKTDYGPNNTITAGFTGPNQNGVASPFYILLFYPRGSSPSGSFPYPWVNPTSAESPIWFRFEWFNGGNNFQSSPFGDVGTELKITSITPKGDGVFVAHYSFTVIPYGTIAGTKATGSGTFDFFVDPVVG